VILLARILSTLLHSVQQSSYVGHKQLRTERQFKLWRTNHASGFKKPEYTATIYTCTVAHHVTCQDLCLQMLSGNWLFGKPKCNRCRNVEKMCSSLASLLYVQGMLNTVMNPQQGSKGQPFWGQSQVLRDFLGGLRFRDRRDRSTERDLCPGPPAKELPRKHALCSLQWRMRPHVVFARHMHPNMC
jgi:hypothetical protein